jgi:hypothetical protein
MSGTTMNWRGRTVEYSCDPAKRPVGAVFRAGGCFFAADARFVGGRRYKTGWRHVEGSVSFNGSGLAANNPIFIAYLYGK